MKRVFSLLLCVLLAVSLGGCAQPQPLPPGTPAPPVQVSSLPDPTPAPTPPPESTPPPAPYEREAVMEYGDANIIINETDEDSLLAYILFPQAGDFADALFYGWAHAQYQDAHTAVSSLRETDPQAEGEVNITFDSYLVSGRFAGVAELGMFCTSAMAHPADVVGAFNLDLQRGVVLKNDEILDPAKLQDVLALLRGKIAAVQPDAVPQLQDMDETWLKNLVIAHDGIRVILERGTALPSYVGLLMLTLPYDELGDALLLDIGDAPHVLPTPAPDPTPGPTAAPTPEPTLEPLPEPTEEEPTPDIPDDAPTPDIPEEPLPQPPATPTAKPTRPPASSSSGREVDPKKPMVALTFDDGPSKYTPEVLDYLEKAGARATFFVVGNLVKSRSSTVLRAYNLGCEIGGHSWSHRDLRKLSDAEVRRELADTAAAIEAITGVRTSMYRPPYGATNATVKAVSKNVGQAIVCWSVDTLDWKTKNADAVYDAIMKDVKDRAIILCHDLHGTTAAAMARVIPELVRRGYQLVTVSELLQAAGKTPQPGVIYYNGK